jgi:uncharacterized protein (TIGR00730 family)
MADRPKMTAKSTLNGANPRDKAVAAKTPAKKSPGGKSGTAKVHASAKDTGNDTGSPIKSMCVYCGSGPGKNPAYLAAAQTLGADMAAAGIGLVYGGGGLGLMGETAKSVLKAGGRVTGIIPQFLSEKERMLKEAHELIITEDMHQRKRLMFDRSDAFVALPGGIGTLEELVEQLTWAQLGRHQKPIILANIDGFWQPFLALLKHMSEEAFIRAGLEVRFVTVERAEDIVPAAIAAAVPGAADDPRLKATIRQF